MAQDGQALTFDAVLTTDMLANVQGGLKRGALPVSELDLTAAWQGEDGWDGLAYVLVTHNGQFSGNYSGDAQYVSSLDLPRGVHMAELWLRKTSRRQHFITTFGLVNVNAIFDVQDVAALFLNASHGIGIDFAQAGTPTKPMGAPGIVMEWRPRADLRLRAGLLDAVAGDPEHPNAFVNLSLSRADGGQYMFEAEKDFDGGYVKLGHWGHTATRDALDGVGRPVKASGSYGLVSATFTREADDSQGLQGWLRAGVADGRVMTFDRYIGYGLVYTGPPGGRDHDQVGLGVARARYGKGYRAAADGPVHEEIAYELSYQAEIRPGLIVQPDIQYVRHPSGRSDIGDAVVVGVRFRAGWQGMRGT